MILAARQLGFWHAVPDGVKQTRGQEVIADGYEPEMPDLDGMERLWQAWNDIGRCGAGVPLPWVEIEAFARMNDMTASDGQTLRYMSSGYLDGLTMTSRLAIAPMEMGDG